METEGQGETTGKPLGVPPAVPAHDAAHEGHIDSTLRSVRTYADDLSEEIKKKGSTLTSIVGAERERTARELAQGDEGERPAPQWRRKVLLFGAGALIVVGIGIVGTAVWLISEAVTPEPVAPSIIFPNKIITVETDSRRPLADQLGIERNATKLSLGEIARFDILVDGATTTASTLLSEFDAPSSLLREVRSVMVGVHSFNRVQPFLILEVTQFDRAYSAMLGWEEELGREFGAFFKPYTDTPIPTTLFVDKVYRNIDTRQSQKEWPILYTFPRRDLLVITTNEQTLQEILTRLAAEVTTSTER